jgi:hypothetical protein
LLNYGVLGAVVVTLSACIAWAGLWARSVVERVVSSYVENDKKRADAAEVVAKTQEQLSDLVAGIDHTLGRHGTAHKATLSALEEIIPPGSPTRREISEARGRLS